MKTIVLTIIFSIVSFVVFAQENILQDYHKMAIDSSPDLKAAYKNYEMALERVPQTSALPNPTLAFAYGLSPVETRMGPQQTKISIMQMFPWFGTLNTKEKQAAFLAQSVYEEYILQLNKHIYNVSNTWYELYFISRSIIIMQQQIEILDMLERQANIKFESNQGGMVDVLRFQMTKEELMAKVNSLIDVKKSTTTKFNMLLNRDAKAAISVADSLGMPDNKIYTIDSVLQNSPGLKALSARQLAVEYQIEAAKKSGYPAIGLGLDYSIIGNRTDMQIDGSGTDVIMPMVSISIPLYRKKYRAERKEAQLNKERTAYQKQSVQNALIVDYEKAIKNYNDALRNIELYKNLLKKANQALHILHTAYATSGKDYDQLLEVQNTLLKYQINYDKAISDLYVAMAYLEYLSVSQTIKID